MEYKIAHGTSILLLTNSVQSLIKEGWKPQGGISVTLLNEKDTQEENKYVFAQAMIKD